MKRSHRKLKKDLAELHSSLVKTSERHLANREAKEKIIERPTPNGRITSTKQTIEEGISNLIPHKRKKKISFLTKIGRFMKKLIKKAKLKMKKIFKIKTKRTRKSSAKNTTKRKEKIMAVVKIELSDDVKQVAAKLREIADKLDPIDVQSNIVEKATPKKEVAKKTVEAKKTKKVEEVEEEFEDVSPFADDDETESETFEEDSFEEEGKSLTIEADIIPACKAFTKKHGEKGRAKLGEILKSFKAKSVHDLKESDYEKFLKKIK